MAKQSLFYQLDKWTAIRSDWNRRILRLERSWRELNQFLDRDRQKERRCRCRKSK